MSSPRTDPLGLVGTTIGEKYDVERVVGEGGFSVVYLAQHRIWKQPVALKVFRSLANIDPDNQEKFLQAFIQEGQLLASLSAKTAAIVQARDIGMLPTPMGFQLPFMVLEWLDGRTLNELIDEEVTRGDAPRDLKATMRLLEAVAIALELAHRQSIAHRDIKPENIFVVGDTSADPPQVKLLDWGIAKVMADAAASATSLHTGTSVQSFTPPYGAPEQFQRTYGATGTWTDVFAFALVLLEVMRGGERALEGEDVVQLALQSCDPTRRPTPRTLGLEVPDEVEAVFARALSVSPDARYRTAGEFWRALYLAAYGRMSWEPTAFGGPNSGPSSRGPSSRPQAGPRSRPPASPGAMTSPSTDTANPPLQQPKSRKPLVALGSAMVAAGAIAGTVWALRGPSVPDSAAIPNSTSGGAPLSSAAAAATCPAGMATIDGGKFFMGSDDPSFALWSPAHKVTLNPYCIDIFEVTSGDYKACSDKGECKRALVRPTYPKAKGATDKDHERRLDAFAPLCNFGKTEKDSHPINCVTWEMANNYCSVRNKRLPTEAEWEFAARGSDGRAFPWGDDPPDQTRMNACGTECTAWEAAAKLRLTPRMYDADDGFAGTSPVGTFPAGKTQQGLMDMVGNVWEWTADGFRTYTAEDAVNPSVPEEDGHRVIRGGAFNGGVLAWLNPAYRYHQDVNAAVHAIGFRCAKNL